MQANVVDKIPPMPADEAQEYLAKLQTGKLQLPDDAGTLEREIFDEVKVCGQRMRELTTQRQDAEKQIEALGQQVKVLGSQIDAVAGEMGGYARLLVSAEGARRKAKAPDKPVKRSGKEPEPAEAPEPEAKANDTATEPAPAPVEDLDAHRQQMQTPPAPQPKKLKRAKGR